MLDKKVCISDIEDIRDQKSTKDAIDFLAEQLDDQPLSDIVKFKENDYENGVLSGTVKVSNYYAFKASFMMNERGDNIDISTIAYYMKSGAGLESAYRERVKHDDIMFSGNMTVERAAFIILDLFRSYWSGILNESGAPSYMREQIVDEYMPQNGYDDAPATNVIENEI